jgi:glutamyl-tRNA reductase
VQKYNLAIFMSILVLGLNHKTASIGLREQLYFALENLPLYLQDLLNLGIAEEAVLLSTCNRSELYCKANHLEPVYDWFCKQTKCPRAEVEQALYLYRDKEAVMHIMQVACGLDSMILGEPQILGQMKAAFSESCTVDAVGPLFHRLFQQVFTVAKEIRTVTEIGACPVSVASAAVHFAKQQFAALSSLPFSEANILLIGAGQTSELLLRYLSSHLSKPISIVNRSREKAAHLGKLFSASFYSQDQLPELLLKADIVFSATGSVQPIISQALVIDMMRQRNTAPLMFIDIAVPRDIEASVADLPNVYLYCIDALMACIEKNKLGREHAALKAREMIEKKSREFMSDSHSFEHVSHTISAYRRQIETMGRSELNKAKWQLECGVDPLEVLETFAHAFTNKLLHTPSVQLRQAGAEGRFELLTLAKQLFAIPDFENERL